MTKSRDNADNWAGDISGVTAGTGLTGGGTSGAVTLNLNTASVIQPTIVDAKGDLIAASANDTPARLAVGSNGDTLLADSSTSTGLRYNPQNALANPVINGGMDIFQRGTASTAIGSGTFLADRWQAARVGFAAGGSQSRQTVSDSTNLPNIQYSLRLQRDSGNTSTAGVIVGQNIESVNSIPFAGKTVTLSFYARAGANFSATSSILKTDFATGTGTDQNFVTSGTLTGISNTQTDHTLTTSWQRFVVTRSIPSNATQIAFTLYFNPTGTAGANDWFEVTGAQIDLGTYTASSAPTFRRSGGTLAGELALAQRYYYRTTPSSAYSRFGLGQCSSTTQALGIVPFPVQMRVAPSALEQTGTASNYAVTNSTQGVVACSSVPTFDGATVNVGSINFTVASGLTAGNATQILPNNNTTAYFGWSAEL